jgi:hypothetical protein
MNKYFAIPALLATVTCAAFTNTPSAYAADFPEMQVGTMIVSSDAAATSEDAVDKAADQQADEEAEDSAS